MRTSATGRTLPKVKELRYTSYSDNDAQTTALANGAAEWSFVFIPNYKTVFIDKDPAHYKLWFPPTLGIHGLWINTTKKPFDDPILRRAIEHGDQPRRHLQPGRGRLLLPEGRQRHRHPDAGR